MKVIIYQGDFRLNPDDDKEVLNNVSIPYSEENVEFAKEHSVNGEYTVEDWAEIQATAQQNIVKGEYITVDGVLYKAITNIPSGEPIATGHNVVETTIEEQLAELAKGE